MKKSVLTFVIALLFGATSWAQLSGPKSIPGDYPTVAAAIADLNIQGVGPGGVTFNVASDYTETFTSSAAGIIIATGTAADPIVFQKSGIGNNPSITAGVGTSVGTGSNPYDAIIMITGGDYITFDGINLTENAANLDATTKMEAGYALVKASKTEPVNGCQYITIRNCTISLSKYATGTTNTTTGIYSGNHVTTDLVNISFTESGDAVNNCKFYNNTISNVTYGMRILGGNVALNIYDQNNEIGVDGVNTITDFTFYGINTRYQRDLKVANNSIFTAAIPVSSLYGIYTQNAAGGSDTYNNTVTLQPSGGNFAINGIMLATGEAGYSANIYGNVVQNCTNVATTSQGFNGISNNGSASTLNFYSNKVTNITFPGTGAFTGMSGGSVATLNMYNNEVSHNSKTGVSGTFTCISMNVSETGNTHDNQIFSNYNCTGTVLPNQGGTIYGINSSNGNPSNIYNNLIYDLSTDGGNYAAYTYGIYVNSGTLVNIYNNYIYDLRATEANSNSGGNLVAGIQMSTQPVALNIYYNTVYLNTTSTGANFSSAALFATINPMVDIKNNIFVNLSEPTGIGITAAYRRALVTLDTYSTLSNANVFYAGDVEDETHTVFYHGGLSADPPVMPQSYTFEEFQAFVGPARESGSFRHLPPFINVATAPYDLHLIDGFPTPCESGGVQITSPFAITTDFDGDLRSSAPDIGADEFNGTPISVVNPGGVTATPVSSHQINVSYSPNASNNDAVIVWNTTGAFTAPAGTPPAVGEAFAGGTVLSAGTSSPVSHTNLIGATSYYYKAFSFDGAGYSLGILVNASTNIAPPSGLTATTFSATQIDLTWSKNAYNNDVIIASNLVDNFGQPVNGTVYAAGNSLPTAGTVIYVGPLSGFSHMGLIPNITTYYYKAWSYDPGNNDIYSQTGITANAKTLCSSATIPFYESFEYGGDIGCGTVVDANNNFDTWSPYFGFAHTGSLSLRIMGGFNSYPKDDWYITNGLELTAGMVYEVKFWYRTQNTSGTPHQLEVKWGNSNTVAGMNSTAVYYNASLTPVTTYTQVTCSLISPAATGIYYVGWHDFSAITPGHNLFLEDITITAIPVPEPPTSLNALADASTINLTYNLNAAGDDVIIATNSTAVFGQPNQGIAYQAGDITGTDGTVIYKGSMANFSHTGLAPNTTYYYKAWSVDGQNLYSTSGVTADATTGDYQLISLAPGWGGISGYKVPENPAIENVLSGIVDKLQIILSVNSGFYWPSQNINLIGNWNTYEGYKIKMNDAAYLTISGEMAQNNTITLNQGVSYLPVLCDQPVQANQIFSQLGNNLMFAFDIQNQLIYWPAGGIYTLNVLEPGVGYLVRMYQQDQVTFNCEKSAAINPTKTQKKVSENKPWNYNESGSQHFISIQKSALAGLENGDFVGVFDSRGLCAGLSQFNSEDGNLLLVVNGDDLTTETTDGFTEGENMTFRIYSPSQKSETEVPVKFDSSMPNAGSFAENGLSIILKMGAGATAIQENVFSNINVHPNPGTGLFTIELPAVDQLISISVENSDGKLIYSEQIGHSTNSSTHTLDLTKVIPGVYFVRISGINQTIVKKVVVI